MSRFSLEMKALVAALVASAQVVGAHAVLVKTSKDPDALRADTATTVVLTFNSRIEPAFTTVVLVDPDRHERPLTSRTLERPGEVEVALPALAAGRYALRYRVLAADGHVTEAMLRFRVVPPE